MKTFIRENPTIAFGLGLPLLLVLVFLLISGVPALLVDPPKHDVLYATEYYNNNQQGVQIAVVDQKVVVSYRGNAQVRQLPRLWRYYAKTGAVKEIAIILPPNLTSSDETTADKNDTQTSTPIKVPDVEGLVIDSSSIAPDGYKFSSGSDRYSRNVFDGLFSSSRYRHQAVLSKDGRRIRLPNADNYYYSQNTRFIGWVMTP